MISKNSNQGLKHVARDGTLCRPQYVLGIFKFFDIEVIYYSIIIGVLK